MSAEPLDARILDRARAGDADALTTLFHRHAHWVQDVAYRVTGSVDEAEDVLQDVFVGLPEALRSYEAEGPLQAWLGRVTTRTALLRGRRETRRNRWQMRAVEQSGASHVPPAAVEARLTLERALARMKEDWRVVYMLYEVEGYGHKDIAEMLGIAEGASQVRLHRARRFLKDRLRGKL